MSNNSNPTDPAFTIGGVSIAKNMRQRISLPLAKEFDYSDSSIPVEVIRGKEDGPVLFISAAIHGDEILGTEVIKRILAKKRMKNIRGTLIAVPIVNVFGYNRKSRYLPDRRDLNRCFPGTSKGSIGSQIAKTFMDEIVARSTHGIDLHTGAIHRTNLPQIRACLDDPSTKSLAEAFGVPVIINSAIRDGSLRQAAADLGIPMLLFEGGEALRYDEKVIRSAMDGILSVMQNISMLPPRKIKTKPAKKKKQVYIAKSSKWIRAPQSGSLRSLKKIGAYVIAGEKLGVISDPFGKNTLPITANDDGIIIGQTMLPLVNNGDACFHIASFKDAEAVEERIDVYDENIEAEYNG